MITSIISKATKQKQDKPTWKILLHLRYPLEKAQTLLLARDIIKTATPVEKRSNYSAFGAPQPGRIFLGNGYRYGFNGQEKDVEINAKDGTLNTAEFWEYDTRIGRRWNLDPIDQLFISNYACFKNNPILIGDVNGDSPGDKDKTKQGKGTAVVAVQGSGNNNNSGVSEKIVVKNEVDKAINGQPSNAVVSGLPAPSTPVTGKSAGFQPQNAVVGLNYTVENAQVTVNGLQAPDAFNINGNAVGTYPPFNSGPPAAVIALPGDVNLVMLMELSIQMQLRLLLFRIGGHYQV